MTVTWSYVLAALVVAASAAGILVERVYALEKLSGQRRAVDRILSA